jgi:hypothetical protein
MTTIARLDELDARIRALETVMARMPHASLIREAIREEQRRGRLGDIAGRADPREVAALPHYEKRAALALLADPVAWAMAQEHPRAWLDELPDWASEQVEVATAELAPRVEVALAERYRGKITITRSPVEISQRQWEDLRREGLDQFVEVRGGVYVYVPPDLSVPRVYTRAEYETIHTIDRQLADLIADGKVKIRPLTRAQLEEHALGEIRHAKQTNHSPRRELLPALAKYRNTPAESPISMNADPGTSGHVVGDSALFDVQESV